MATLIDKINLADRTIQMAREGFFSTIEVLERLVNAGFYDVKIIKEGFNASYDGLNFIFRYEHKGLLL